MTKPKYQVAPKPTLSPGYASRFTGIVQQTELALNAFQAKDLDQAWLALEAVCSNARILQRWIALKEEQN